MFFQSFCFLWIWRFAWKKITPVILLFELHKHFIVTERVCMYIVILNGSWMWIMQLLNVYIVIWVSCVCQHCTVLFSFCSECEVRFLYFCTQIHLTETFSKVTINFVTVTPMFVLFLIFIGNLHCPGWGLNPKACFPQKLHLYSFKNIAWQDENVLDPKIWSFTVVKN